MPYGTIYMLPTPIGDRPVYDVLPEYNRAVMARLDYFIVENERTARRFLSRAGIGKPIDGLRIAELNEHTTPEQVAELLENAVEYEEEIRDRVASILYLQMDKYRYLWK